MSGELGVGNDGVGLPHQIAVDLEGREPVWVKFRLDGSVRSERARHDGVVLPFKVTGVPIPPGVLVEPALLRTDADCVHPGNVPWKLLGLGLSGQGGHGPCP